MKKSALRIVGETEDGHLVAAGVFRLEDTLGIPLDTALQILRGQGIMPDWLDFYSQARRNGWKRKTVLNKLGPALSDVYGPEFSEVVTGRLRELEREENA